MTKHTPGPWGRNIRANGKYPVVFAGRNQHVAIVSQQKNGAETEANIDLIAAAPDLLDALRAIVEVAGPQFGLDDTPGTINAISRLARAAIARAEG